MILPESVILDFQPKGSTGPPAALQQWPQKIQPQVVYKHQVQKGNYRLMTFPFANLQHCSASLQKSLCHTRCWRAACPSINLALPPVTSCHCNKMHKTTTFHRCASSTSQAVSTSPIRCGAIGFERGNWWQFDAKWQGVQRCPLNITKPYFVCINWTSFIICSSSNLALMSFKHGSGRHRDS